MKRDKYLSQYYKRWARVVYLRDEKGLTFEEIGQKLKPPVSRQRASKMYQQGKANEKVNGSGSGGIG